MPNHHFISYSSADAKSFAVRLANELKVGPPSFKIWLDEYDIRAGEDWDEQIAEGIRACEALIFVMTPDSVKSNSVCKNEWTWALKYKKPIMPLRLHHAAELPFRLASRDYIDFSSDFDRALAELRNRLDWLPSPAGQLQALKHRLADSERDLPRTRDEHERQRIQDEITQLQQQIADQTRVVTNPQAVAQAVQARIDSGLERERKPEHPVSGATRTKFINPPPATIPSYFQDRHVETRLLVEQLQAGDKRLLTVVGRGGVGKTAMVCRLLKGIETGRLPDDLEKELGPLPIDGLVYLSQNGSHPINTANLFAALGQLLPSSAAQQMDALYRDPKLATAVKVQQLLEHFGEKRVIVLLDNLEDLVDSATRQLSNQELDEMLRTVLKAPVHGVTLIGTTRIAPSALALVQPQLQYTLHLDEGLPSPYAENILRAMDADGKLGLQDATAALLSEARGRTRGYPRALEALVAILSSDRSTNLLELLGDAKRYLPEHVVETLVGEAYSRLDHTAQTVIQGLAIYARPVTGAAIDFLLQPYLAGINATAVLNRLVNMYFVRKESDRYYLHPVDRAYALERVREGNVGDGDAKTDIEPLPFTRYALWHRAADYFAQARRPRAEWKTLADLAAQLAEFDLRCTAAEYAAAADLLSDIDFDYLLLWGHARLLVELHERLQGKLSDPTQKRDSLGTLGSAYADLGETQRAIEFYTQALTIAQAIGNRRNEGVWLGNLGNAYADLGETQRAIEFYTQALTIAQAIGDRRGEGNHLGNLGNAYADLGETQRAIEFYTQALTIAQAIGDRRGEGNRLGALGNAYAALGETQRAIEFYTQALTIAQAIGDRRGEGNRLGNLGLAYAALGETQRAIEFYTQALTIAQAIGDRRNEGVWLGALGNAYADLGETQRAIEFYTQALTIAQAIGDRRGEGNHLGNLGLAYAALGETQRAIEFYTQALTIAQAIGDRRGEGAALGALGSAYADLGETQRAIEFYTQALTIAQAIGDRRGEGNHLGNLGLAYADLGETQRAIEFYTQALTIAQAIGDRRGEGSHLGNLGLAYAALGETQRAIEQLQKALVLAKEINYPYGESIRSVNLAHALLDQSKLNEATALYNAALHIADEIQNRQAQSESSYGLALAYLVAGELAAAAQTIAIAQQHDHPTNNANVLALAGIIQLRLGQVVAAQAAFAAAVVQAGSLLQQTAQNYAALESKGLALAGLALCDLALGAAADPPAGQDRVPQAETAYRAARAITKAPGSVARTLRLFDALAVADSAGVLAGVRRVVTGEAV